MHTHLTADTMSSLPTSSPFTDVYSDRHFLPISLYTTHTNHSTLFNPQMDELNSNFTCITLNDHPALAGSELYQRFISPYGSRPHIAEGQSLPLYAPVPSQGHGPTFMCPDFVHREDPSFDEAHTPDDHFYDSQNSPPEILTYDEQLADSPDTLHAHFWDGDSFPPTFPTPSELLAELAEKGLPVTHDEFATDTRSESTSKARRRAMARSVGFVPTDPDSISSHEKKRHYLATLEQYVFFLSEQLELAGMTPDHIVQMHSSKGLSSQSIRILLVHMTNVTRKLNQATVANEQKYLALSAEVARREALLLRRT